MIQDTWYFPVERKLLKKNTEKRRTHSAPPSPPLPPPQKKTDKRFRAKNWRNSDKNKSYIMQILFVLNLLFRMIIRLEMNIIDSSGLFHVMIVFFHWKRQLTRSVIE